MSSTNFYYPSIPNDICERVKVIEERLNNVDKDMDSVKTEQILINKRIKIIHNLFNEYKSDKDTLYDFLNKQLGKINMEMLNEQKIVHLERQLSALKSQLKYNANQT